MNEVAMRELAERMFHDIERSKQDLKVISDLISKDNDISEGFKTWFFKELGKAQGWEQDLRGG